MSCKVLLTGISGWIGKHIAIKLLKEGHHVVGTVRNQNLIEPTKDTLKSKDTPLDNLSFVVLDLLKDEGWDEAAKGCRYTCLLYTSPSPRDRTRSRMPSSA